MHTDHFGIRLGGNGAEYISLGVSGRQLPDSGDYWDANWLICHVEIAAGAFRGFMAGTIRTEELERFHGQLQRLNDELHGKAEFETMEDWLSVRLAGDGRGHIEARCRVGDGPGDGDGNTLTCRLSLDQTFLTPLLKELSQLMEAYPVWFKGTVA